MRNEEDDSVAFFGVRKENDVSFFGVTASAIRFEAGAGDGTPNEKPVVGVLAAFRLSKNEAVAASGLEGLDSWAGVETPALIMNGELAKVENGEFFTSVTAPATLPIDFVVTVDAVDGGRVTEMVGVPRIEGLIGVVLAEVVGDVDDFGAGRGCETFGNPKFACDVASKPTPITGVRAVA